MSKIDLYGLSDDFECGYHSSSKFLKVNKIAIWSVLKIYECWFVSKLHEEKSCDYLLMIAEPAARTKKPHTNVKWLEPIKPRHAHSTVRSHKVLLSVCVANCIASTSRTFQHNMYAHSRGNFEFEMILVDGTSSMRSEMPCVLIRAKVSV